jgi:hypothetical protein
MFLIHMRMALDSILGRDTVRGFAQPVQISDVILLRLRHDRFPSNPFQFIIRPNSPATEIFVM